MRSKNNIALLLTSVFCLAALVFCVTQVCRALRPNVPIINLITKAKYNEMLDVVVKIEEPESSGSGVLIAKFKLLEDLYEYWVITYNHVVDEHTIIVDPEHALFYHKRVQDDPIQYSDPESAPETKILKEVDVGCKVVVFDSRLGTEVEYDGDISLVDPIRDLAIVKFNSPHNYKVALIANELLLPKLSVFDEVYAVGCQLGLPPVVTYGIIGGFVDDKEFKGIIHNAEISPGSSGGGLFREFDGHYYLIGIPNRLPVRGYQFIAHYAMSIHGNVLIEFLKENGFGRLLVQKAP